MATVAYGMADLAGSADGRVGPGAVTVSGGCGQSHGVQVDKAGHPYIECDVCAPIQVSRHYGWSSSPAGVPPTPDEVAQRELAEREGTAATSIMLRQVSEALAGAAVAKLGGAGAGSLLDQLKALDADERDALLSQLGVPAAEEPAPVKTAGRGRATAGKSGGGNG